MVGLTNKFSQLLPKLLLAFWITSTLTIGVVIGLPLLQEKWDNEPLAPHFANLLQRVAMRMDSNPELTINQVNKLLRRTGNLEHEQPRRHDKQDDKNRPEIPQVQLYLIDTDGSPSEENRRRIPRSVRQFLLDFEQNGPMHQRQFGNSLVFGPKRLADGSSLVGRLDQHNKPWLFELLQRPWLLLILATIVSTIVFGLLAWNLSNPLRQLRQATTAVARGELDARIDGRISKRSDEIGQLGRSFNLMADSVSTMVTSQQRLLSDISHELRTPLTRLKLSLAIAQRKGQQSDELTRIGTEADQLEAMLHELLALSRLNLQATDRKIDIDLISILQPVIDGAQFEAQELNKMVVVTQPQSLPYYGVDTLLQRMLENPLRNALHYANHKVQVTLRKSLTGVEIDIVDDGNGVPEHELESIFRPFHRVDDARDRSSGGWGLGLAISFGAAEAHQGTISAHNQQGAGLRVTIKLPLLQ
ncbi:ATP-binding protein [Ferrimonas lipolytica]|uniref:histidine kinase n=1 Tax=Ferrimonas lipolytica TaxID=2724191 RepID=A0A6H1UHN8_9GAMM|nr:ATP-binding protein [Ferrimonas lipolytica]QIZ78120.1 HAMP domain-containing protein [Ferrimonas lipolytica]